MLHHSLLSTTDTKVDISLPPGLETIQHHFPDQMPYRANLAATLENLRHYQRDQSLACLNLSNIGEADEEVQKYIYSQQEANPITFDKFYSHLVLLERQQFNQNVRSQHKIRATFSKEAHLAQHMPQISFVTSTPQRMHVFCSMCGSQRRPDHIYCSNCGMRFDSFTV